MGLREKRRHRRYARAVKKNLCIIVWVISISVTVGIILGYFRSNHGEVTSKKTDVETDKKEVIRTEITKNIETESKTATQSNKVKESEDAVMSVMENDYQRILALSAGEQAATGLVANELTDRLFFCAEIDEVIFTMIDGVSYTQNEYVDVKDLKYLKILCYGRDGNTYVGEMIVNEKIADTVLKIFKTLYEKRYPIERMVLVDEYQADDESSMSANNTSAFNYRPIAGSNKLSKHSYGMAIDINPLYNPCVKTGADGSVVCQPANGAEYADRTKEFIYKIDENDLAYQLFTEAGFTWGGSWNSLKDYQHFEMAE